MDIPFKYFSNDRSNKLIVMLPAVTDKDIFPYYPRISWAKELNKNFSLLYISDPFQNLTEYSNAMGSWFIGLDGNSVLENVALLIEKKCVDGGYEDVLLYGSSMGGYAALMLSKYVNFKTKVIAECPQLFLKNHPGSRSVVEMLSLSDSEINNLEPLSKIAEVDSKTLIICSAFDHHIKSQIIPFMNHIYDMELDNVEIRVYSDSSYKRGHVALNKQDAFNLITEVC
tara:strand:+ start:756 stop:1436 length:681 start_codon:yes stop_codon:yes gene_type:complete